MKSSKLKRPPARLRSGIAALVIAMSAAIGTGTVHAAGTASGTTISNQATLSYQVGGVGQTAINSSPTGVGPALATTFTVDNKVNVTVATTDASFISVVPGSNAQVTTFTVTNNGNTVQDFALTSVQVVGGALHGGTDNFDATGCAQYVESSGAANGYQVGVDIATFIDELAPDVSKTVYVVCNIPAGQVNSDNAIVALRATALAGGTSSTQGAALTQTTGPDTGGVDIVFADVGGLDDSARDAAHSSRSVYRVVTAALSVAKTSTLLCDPFNGQTNPKHIPGAIVRWTITITNAAGAASATLSTVTDTINTTLTTFDANLVTGVGTCTSAGGTPAGGAGNGFRVSIAGGTRAGPYPKYFTTANDSDSANLNGALVTVNYATALPAESGYAVGELRQNESVTVVFNVTIQ